MSDVFLTGVLPDRTKPMSDSFDLIRQGAEYYAKTKAAMDKARLDEQALDDKIRNTQPFVSAGDPIKTGNKGDGNTGGGNTGGGTNPKIEYTGPSFKDITGGNKIIEEKQTEKAITSNDEYLQKHLDKAGSLISDGFAKLPTYLALGEILRRSGNYLGTKATTWMLTSAAAKYGLSSVPSFGTAATGALGATMGLAGTALSGVSLGYSAVDIPDKILKYGAQNVESQEAAKNYQEFIKEWYPSYVGERVNEYADKLYGKDTIDKMLLEDADPETKKAINEHGYDKVRTEALKSMLLSGDSKESQAFLSQMDQELYGTEGKGGILNDVAKKIQGFSTQGSEVGHFGSLGYTDLVDMNQRNMLNDDMVAESGNFPKEWNELQAIKNQYVEYKNAEYKDPDQLMALAATYADTEMKYYRKIISKNEERVSKISDPDLKKQAILNVLRLRTNYHSVGQIDTRDLSEWSYWDQYKGFGNKFKMIFND